MQDASRVVGDGATLSRAAYRADHWYRATVPGTVLTTLVDNGVYPEPTYGENDRPEVIPDSLARAAYWYRTVVPVPKEYKGKHVWLTFEGINYTAEVWVEGHPAGTIRGAFQRGVFDVSGFVRAGSVAGIAVKITPQPHPGEPHEHTLRAGMGPNGGVTASDGATFLATIGWDWMPAQRDRDAGIWREVRLSATGPLVLRDPYVTSNLELPSLARAGLTVRAMVENVSDTPQDGVLRGVLEGARFERAVHVPAHASVEIVFAPGDTPGLMLQHPRVWWPNGYGPQNLYTMRLAVAAAGANAVDFDTQEVTFGVRSISYRIASTDNLGFVVNGVPVFIRGGDWGMDEVMKRIPPERMEAQIRMHQQANLNMIRNWVGQSTSEQFYALCDRYGLLVWDEFFQPNPLDGPDPIDLDTYLANVKDKVLRFRNHPSIVLWCARNEGDPPAQIDAALRAMLASLDPTRLYQANSSDGRGVRSHGPYHWRAPRDFYMIAEGLKTETGSVSVPTIESIQGMMPEKDWETITDDWAEHDFARGASGADTYPATLAARFGPIANLADFVRKAQLANYEAFRAMYEGRNAAMFHPSTGVLTWMSHPAQPSFVWQLYHYDLEPNASLFAVQHASEMVHVQFNEIMGGVQVVNNRATALQGTSVHVQVFNLDGTRNAEQTLAVSAPASSVVDAGTVEMHEPLTTAHFIEIELRDAGGATISRNFYWHNEPESADQFQSLETMSRVTLEATAVREDVGGVSTIRVTLHNPGPGVALMTHLQLHRASGARVLPAFYSDNYVSLAGGESATVAIECKTAALSGESAAVLLDGFNVGVKPSPGAGVSMGLNENAQVEHWPRTGLPFQTVGLR